MKHDTVVWSLFGALSMAGLLYAAMDATTLPIVYKDVLGNCVNVEGDLFCCNNLPKRYEVIYVRGNLGTKN